MQGLILDKILTYYINSAVKELTPTNLEAFVNFETHLNRKTIDFVNNPIVMNKIKDYLNENIDEASRANAESLYLSGIEAIYDISLNTLYTLLYILQQSESDTLDKDLQEALERAKKKSHKTRDNNN